MPAPQLALRLPWLIAGVGQLVLLAFAATRLTTAKIEAARAAVSDDIDYTPSMDEADWAALQKICEG